MSLSGTRRVAPSPPCEPYYYMPREMDEISQEPEFDALAVREKSSCPSPPPRLTYPFKE